ncbi:zonular occludens toxin domain-containing protein [Rheinheimera sp.]|uniref:zonular occludens toxin domain-containing protein n=1 Tax=Rheinheimera sp. TaxID=1869214 RepID=UPI00307EF9A0
MPVYVITGKLGAGKSLAAVGRIQEYLLQGRKVATNLNLYPENLMDYWKKNTELYRIPNKPTVHDLNALPLGHDEDKPNDSRNGALVLDECGTWFNSRSWNDKDRGALIEWCRNARKKRWDIYFIIQDVSVMDSQARESFAEHVVYCRRLDRFNIPVLSWFGQKIKMPKMHLAVVKYGDGAYAPTVDRWWYNGANLYNCYDTEQSFSGNDEIQALTRYLPAYFTHGRYITRWEKFKNDLKTQNYGKRHFFLAGAFVAAFAVNALVLVDAQEPKKGLWTCNAAYKKLFGSCDAEPIAPYEYYYPKSELAGSEAPPNDAGKASKTEGSKKGPDPEPEFYYSASVFVTGKGFEYYWVDAANNPVEIGPHKVMAQLTECSFLVKMASGKELVVRCAPNQPQDTRTAFSPIETKF